MPSSGRIGREDIRSKSLTMTDDVRSWDETEETGLRLCCEHSMPHLSLPAEVTACCWDANAPGMVGLCGADGSFVVANHDGAGTGAGTTTATARFAVYFNTLPLHLWGRERRGRDGGEPFPSPPAVASAPARRVPQPWSQVSFVPGRAGEVVFVQGWSFRVLWACLPMSEIPRSSRRPSALPLRSGGSSGGGTGGSAEGRFGLVDGSRVVALDGHQAQVRCLSIDDGGELLLTGDESGLVCVRLLHASQLRSSNVTQGNQGIQGTAYRNLQQQGSSEVRRAWGADPVGGGGVSKVLKGAHVGGVFAVAHVEGSLRMARDGTGSSSTLFVSGGRGGVVRVWKATRLIQARRQTDGAGIEVHVELINDMLVGGFQVSCLHASLSFQIPVVLTGTAEGTVFAFRLPAGGEGTDRREHGGGSGGGGGVGGNHGEGGGAGSAQQGGGNGAEMCAVVMKFEHTTQGIESVCCSHEQELIAVADAEGIVRTYRPTSRGDAIDDLAATKIEESPSGSPRLGERGDGSAKPFELVVECRLGARPVLCEFSSEMSGISVVREKEEEEKRTRGPRDGGDAHGEGEVLRTCSVKGDVRVWPTALLPARPVRPMLPPRPPPPSSSSSSGGDHKALDIAKRLGARNASVNCNGGGGPGNDSLTGRPIVTGTEQESVDPSDAFSKWASAIDANGHDGDDSRGRGGGGGGWGYGDGGEGVARGEETRETELMARSDAPVPVTRPAAPRRVSFAEADEIYNLEDYDGPARQRDLEAAQDFSEDLEAPRPAPPAPTPMSTPSPSGWNGRRRRLQGRTWEGGTDLGGSSSGEVERGRRRVVGDSARDESGAFVTPSKLQEAALWSTAVEQAALEQRMREGFDLNAFPEQSDPAHNTAAAVAAAAASVAVNIHPLAKTFEGLVPVSLDAPPPRFRRKGKQVNKDHLSKVQEQRITEEDLAFDDMEPDCGAVVSFGSSGGSGMWPHEELEWYGRRGQFAELGGAPTASDRVWSLSLGQRRL